jgi:NADH-quinone oxidoreductase subunit N
MAPAELVALSPLVALAGAPVLVMLAVALGCGHRWAWGLTLLGLAVPLGLLPVASSAAPQGVTLLLVMDHFALFYIGLVLAAGLAVAAPAHGYLEGRGERPEAFYMLLLLAILGAAVLAASNHFASFFLGLELLSTSLFALVAYPARRRQPLEAGAKYLILAGVSSAFLLFGMALVYAELGTMSFGAIGSLLAAGEHFRQVYLIGGFALILVGVGFKLSLVPFHMWAPDVYQGAPAPVTALVATISKGGVFAVLLRYFTEAEVYRYGRIALLLGLIAVVSMLAGNLLALLQSSVKRLLAYSSIAHLGYLLVALLAGGTLAAEAVGYYLAAYFVTMLGAFSVVARLGGPGGDADALADYHGLFWRRPWLAGTFTAMLLSLAGMPLTMGFVGKFYVVAAGVDAGLWPLVLVLVAASVIGLFYYLRVVVAMVRPPGEAVLASPAESPVGDLVLVALILLLIGLGVYPGPLIQALQTAPLT